MWILFIISLTVMPSGSYGISRDTAPTVTAVEMGSKTACLEAARQVYARIPPEQQKLVRMVCVPKE